MKKRFLNSFLLVILILISILFSSCGKGESKQDNISSKEEENNRAYGVEVGDYATELTLEDLAGDDKSLKDYKGKYLVLNFWATWCPPCRAEMGDFNQFYLDNKDEIVVLGVNVGENKEKVKKFIESKGYQYPILLDQNQMVANTYRIRAFPTNYFISPEGKVLGVKVGMMKRRDLDEVKKNLFGIE